MFGLDSETLSRIDQTNQEHAASYLAIAIVLIEKGIINGDELAEARLRATHMVEQEWAKKKEEAQKEFEEKYPAFSQILGNTFKDKT